MEDEFERSMADEFDEIVDVEAEEVDGVVTGGEEADGVVTGAEDMDGIVTGAEEAAPIGEVVTGAEDPPPTAEVGQLQHQPLALRPAAQAAAAVATGFIAGAAAVVFIRRRGSRRLGRAQGQGREERLPVLSTHTYLIRVQVLGRPAE